MESTTRHNERFARLKDAWDGLYAAYSDALNTPEENRRLWDGYARDYDNYADDACVEEVVSRVVGECSLRPGARVLDVGCGTGNHSIAFARAGMAVDALDFSGAMLDVARAKAARTGLLAWQGDRALPGEVRLLKADFKTLDLWSEHMAHAYDLVFCSLNPACYRWEMIERLMSASRGSCCVVMTDGQGSTSAMQQVCTQLGLALRHVDQCCDALYPLGLLNEAGYSPQVFYAWDCWQATTSPQSVEARLCDRLPDLSGPKLAQARALLQLMAREGGIPESSWTRLVCLHWKVAG